MEQPLPEVRQMEVNSGLRGRGDDGFEMTVLTYK